jgi:hypothetical protein
MGIAPGDAHLLSKPIVLKIFTKERGYGPQKGP